MKKGLISLLFMGIFMITSVFVYADDSTNIYVQIEYTDTSSSVEMLIPGKEIKITVTSFDKNIDGYFVSICCYNHRGELIKIYSSDQVETKYEQFLTIPDDIYMLKVLAWEDVACMRPLMDSYTKYRCMDYQKPIGDGTEAFPYEITSAEELAYIFIENTKSYVLKNNIDLTAYSWMPSTFSGTLDGQGYCVTGLNISENTEYSGLVACLRPQRVSMTDYPYGYYVRAYIKNLNVEVMNSGKNAAVSGGIAGEQYAFGEIIHCKSSGNITAFAPKKDVPDTSVKAGGITGLNVGGTIEDCVSDANVTGIGGSACYVGGIVGKGAVYVNELYPQIKNCESSGMISAITKQSVFDRNKITAGGIIGYNSGMVEACKTSSQLYSDGVCGGIVGYFDEEYAAYTKVIDCIDHSILLTE